nr:zinc metalloproteinase nas-13-like [Onthophagus taurus]
MFSIKLIFVAILCHFTLGYPYVKKLSPEQVHRLKTWTEDDKQNIWELSGQVEGDMVLTDNQRNGLIETYYRWTNNVIPYEIDAAFTAEEAEWIQSSLDAYAENSCVTVRRKVESDIDYIYVTGEDSGCWSYVGRFGGKQTINLQKSAIGSGCLRSGTIVHEFLHAAGFYHQQSASDRDDFVDIIWDNIQQGTESNFAKYTEDKVTDFGEGYDYDSVMHYGEYAFSANGERTIVPKDPTAVIGQRIGMSEKDINKLNKMYCS